MGVIYNLEFVEKSNYGATRGYSSQLTRSFFWLMNLGNQFPQPNCQHLSLGNVRNLPQTWLRKKYKRMRIMTFDNIFVFRSLCITCITYIFVFSICVFFDHWWRFFLFMISFTNSGCWTLELHEASWLHMVNISLWSTDRLLPGFNNQHGFNNLPGVLVDAFRSLTLFLKNVMEFWIWCSSWCNLYIKNHNYIIHTKLRSIIVYSR